RLEQEDDGEQDQQPVFQLAHQVRTRPPSTFSVCPVMKAASSLVRYDTVPTRSSGVSTRLIACMPAAWLNSASMSAMPARGLRASVPGERVRPGEIALT